MITQLAKVAFRAAGFDVRRTQNGQQSHEPDFDPLQDQPTWIKDIITSVRPYTMTSPERIAALCQAVVYIERFKIPGDIVECGVWRGGSMMAAAMTMRRFRNRRRLHLFDTFKGMSPPTDVDIEAHSGRNARDLLVTDGAHDVFLARSPLTDVKTNLRSTAYPMDHIHFVEGKVEDTIPSSAPETIAILRLDTDWYESTKHELIHLWPRLVSGGILIIDDYGHWTGARKAVDEFIEDSELRVFLNRIDYTGRMIVKP